MTDRTKRLLSTHITTLIPKSESALPSDIECLHSASNYLSAGSSDGLLRLWRISDGELLIEQHLHIGSLSVLLIDPLLWVIFAGSTTGRIGAWSIPELFNSGESDQIWSVHTLKITDLCLSSGCRVFSVSLDKTAKCFDFAIGCEIFSVNFPSALTCCALLHNESILYCGETNGNIYQIQLAQDGGELPPLMGHNLDICDLLVSEDDRVLFSCALDGAVRRWDTGSGQTMQQIQVKGVPFGMRFLPSCGEMKKGFPRLGRAVSGNKDELVSRVVEDVEILSAEDEMAIAVADIAAQQPMAMGMMGGEGGELEVRVKDERDAEIQELRRKNGEMFQMLLAHGYKE
jgi:WD40 repeat protein